MGRGGGRVVGWRERKGGVYINGIGWREGRAYSLQSDTSIRLKLRGATSIAIP